MLSLSNIHASIDTKPILKGIDLVVAPGETHIVMGPNGSGKSTLSHVTMGDTRFVLTEGQIMLEDQDITALKPEERAKKGLFLSYQNPVTIEGLPLLTMLYAAYSERELKKQEIVSPKDAPNEQTGFMKFVEDRILKPMVWLDLEDDFLQRGVNEGLSGGERKKTEILQLAALRPKYAILDEIDSGLDIDATKTVFAALEKIRQEYIPDLALVIITHNTKLLDYIKPTMVHVMLDGQIVVSGDTDLIKTLEQEGFKQIKN